MIERLYMDPNNQVPQYPQNQPEEPTVPPTPPASTPEPYQPAPVSTERPIAPTFESPASTSTPESPSTPLSVDSAERPMFAAPVTNSASAPTGEDPGKGLAIAGIVLAFFFNILGLILSIVARKKSKAAGYDGSLAKIGIILNSIFLALGVLVAAALIAVMAMSYSDMQNGSGPMETQSIESDSL